MEALSKDELLAILQAAKDVRPRDWLMILVHFWHGGRASEIIQLTPDSISDGYIIFDRLKGSDACKQRLVEHGNPLLNERDALIELAAETPAFKKLFPICRQHYWRIIRKHALSAGIPKHKAKTTTLKATLGTLLIENMPINKVQRRLGHKSLSSTGQYMKAKEADVDEIVVKAVDI